MTRPAGKQHQLAIRAACLAAAALICAFAFPSAATADLFVLKSGGQIRGRWLNRGERPLVAYEIETSYGGRMKLAKDQVETAIFERAAITEYEQIAPTFENTIDDQWKLAEWCRENTLLDQRRVHLRRILDVDPDHPRARRGLGYSQVDGRWVTLEQFHEEKGLRYYQGRWRNAHEIKILEARDEQNRAERQWLMKLKKLNEALPGPNSLEAKEEILAVRNPHAVRALVASLYAAPQRAARFLYLEAIHNVGTHGAAQALVEISLNHPDIEVFYESVEQIVELAPPGVSKPYIDALRDPNNVRVNRAGFALGRLGDKQALGPLIESLITTHTIVLVDPRGNDAISTTFSRPGTGAAAGVAVPGVCRDRGALTGMTAGNQTKVIPTRVPNQRVLDALVELSEGASFGFDQQAWRNWHDQEKSRLPAITARGE